MKKLFTLAVLAIIALPAMASPRFDKNFSLSQQVIDLALKREVVPDHATNITSDGSRLYYKVGFAEVKVVKDFRVYEVKGVSSQNIADFMTYHEGMLKLISVVENKDGDGFIIVSEKVDTNQT